MNTSALPIPSSAAASPRASATPSLELREARQARDGLANLLSAERTAAAEFLLALSDFDRRRGWEPLGYASLFAFLRVELRLSSGAAFWRMSAARLLQRFPDLIEPLRDGRLCLSTTAELAKVLTDENRSLVLPRFFGLSAREAKEVVAELAPREAPPVRAVVTRVDRQTVDHPLAASAEPVPHEVRREAPSDLAAPVAFRTSETELARPARVPERRDQVEPLTAELRRLHLTVDRQFLKQLGIARDGLSHVIPGATAEQVLKAALEALLEKQARARGQVKRPRKRVASTTPVTTTPAPTSAEPLHRRPGPREAVPADVRRAVWKRDQGRCQWPLDSGGRCGSTHQVELDHLKPWARGGDHEVEDLRLLCHRHNQLAARQAFGARCMERYAGKRGRGEGRVGVSGSAGSGTVSR